MMYGICEEALNSWTLDLMRSGCMGAAGTGVMMHMAGHTWCSAANAVHLRLRCGHVMVFMHYLVFLNLVHLEQRVLASLLGNTGTGSSQPCKDSLPLVLPIVRFAQRIIQCRRWR